MGLSPNPPDRDQHAETEEQRADDSTAQRSRRRPEGLGCVGVLYLTALSHPGAVIFLRESATARSGG